MQMPEKVPPQSAHGAALRTLSINDNAATLRAWRAFRARPAGEARSRTVCCLMVALPLGDSRYFLMFGCITTQARR